MILCIVIYQSLIGKSLRGSHIPRRWKFWFKKPRKRKKLERHSLAGSLRSPLIMVSWSLNLLRLLTMSIEPDGPFFLACQSSFKSFPSNGAGKLNGCFFSLCFLGIFTQLKLNFVDIQMSLFYSCRNFCLPCSNLVIVLEFRTSKCPRQRWIVYWFSWEKYLLCVSIRKTFCLCLLFVASYFFGALPLLSLIIVLKLWNIIPTIFLGIRIKSHYDLLRFKICWVEFYLGLSS